MTTALPPSNSQTLQPAEPNGQRQDGRAREVPNGSNNEPPPALTHADTNALVEYVRKLSPLRLSILTGLFLAAVAALLVIKFNDENQSRRLEAELRLARTVQNGALSMNVDIMTGNPAGEALGTDLPPGALVSFYHLSASGDIIASAGRFEAVSLDPLTIASLPLTENGNLILDFSKAPIAVSWQALDNGEILMAATPARDMFGRTPLWIGYSVLLGAITMVSASLMRAFIRQNAAACDAAEALTGYIKINDALANGRCCPWYYNEMTRRVLLSRALLEPLGLGARDRYFTLQELTSLIHPQDLRAALSVFTGDKTGVCEGVARLRQAGGGWSRIMIRTDSEAGRRQRSGIAFDVTGSMPLTAPVNTGTNPALALDPDTDLVSVDKERTSADWIADHLQDGVDTIPDAFLLWDEHGQLVGWNRRFMTLFRFEENSLHPGMTPAAIVEAAGGGKEIINQYFVPQTDTLKSAIEVGLSSDRWIKIIRRQTESGGIVCLASNITDQKRRARSYTKRERQLERTVADLEKSRRELSEISRNYAFEKRRAEDASRSKSEFLANMSHELRTPLNAINGFSEVMQSELYGPLGNGKYREYIDDIHASGRHLLELIDDILDMSRIEAGRLQLEPQRLELDRILQESIRLVTRRADDAGVDLTASIANAPPIWADGRATKQVLLNLLANAVKFTGNAGKISLVTEADLDCVSVMIVDSGPGIEKSHLLKLGSPFELGQNKFTGARDGSGLGLALSKSLMELQGGLLALASTPGKGTTACATFPRRDGAPVRLPQYIRSDAHILTREPVKRPKDTQSPDDGSGNGKSGPISHAHAAE